MSYRKNKNNHNTTSEKSGFELYREIAPAVVEDNEIHKIMKLHNNQDDKIKVAIQNLWNVVPERHLNAESEWKTLDRTRKSNTVSKENEKPSQAHTSESDRGRGKGASTSDRGSSTRGGRSASASGRGGRGSSGRSESRSNTRTKDATTTIAVDNTNTGSWDSSAWNTSSATIAEASNGAYSKPVTVGIAWKSTETFAERIKRQNAEAELAARLVQQEEAVSESLLSGDNDPLDVNNNDNIYSDEPDDVAIELEASVAELTIDNSAINHVEKYNIDPSNIIQDPLDETHEEILSSVPANLISDQSLQQSVNIDQSNEPEDSSNNDPAYLKMGRWAESSVAAPFQFGSFGKDISEEVQASSWSNDIAVNDSSPDVWNGSNPSGLDINNNGQSGISNSLFNQSKPVSSDKYEQKPPPGFVGGSIAPARSNSKPDAVSQSPQSAPNIPYQYPAPPGISGNVRGLPQGYPTPNPYYPPPGYDIPPAQYLSPYAPQSVAQPPASSQVSGSASTSNGTGSTAATNNTSNPPQQPQQYAPYGYFGNPYYPNQYYYSHPQMPYYGQPRGIYQPPRGPYGGDPYGNPGPVYGDMYSGGVYPDASGYGGYPSAVSNSGPNPNGGKVPKGGVGSNATTNAPVADHNNNYGYLNHYNPRNDPQGWGYQQNPPVWQPMMAYSGVNPAAQSAPPSAGQTPASSAQQQAQQTQRPPANTYGANSFAGRNGNPAASSAGQTW